MSKPSKPAVQPKRADSAPSELAKPASQLATFYRVVRKSLYEYELQSVGVDTANIQVVSVGHPDIKSRIIARLEETCE